VAAVLQLKEGDAGARRRPGQGHAGQGRRCARGIGRRGSRTAMARFRQQNEEPTLGDAGRGDEGAGRGGAAGDARKGDDAPGGRRQHLFVDVQEEGEQEREGNLGLATCGAGMRCRG
jgi:hypothetical protein